MEINKIYKSNNNGSPEYIFILKNGVKIIKRNNDKTKKLNIKQWEEISFIPDDFKEADKVVTEEEKNRIENVLNNNNKDNKLTSLWDKIKNIF